MTWNSKFMNLCSHISFWSKDRSTKVGSVIVDKDNRVLSMGYNGFPSGLDDNIDSRHERPAKYLYTEHAERNAIYSAAKNGVAIEGATIYVQWFPCADCARAIIQSGIKTLVCTEPEHNERWNESFEVSKEMLLEAGVEIVYFNTIKHLV